MNTVVEQLKFLRAAGIPMTVATARAIMLAHIEHHAPELLKATGPDKIPFFCSDGYVRKFIYHNLQWVPRASTRAAQKTPADAEQQIFELFLRLALWIRDAGIRDPELIVNFDQTQVVVSDNTAHTFDVEGSKQIGIVGKEEKRAFTAVLAVSASGALLPTQFIWKGATERSLPSSTAPSREEAARLGFLFSYNPDTYWSDFGSMEQFIENIVVPFFMEHKRRLGYPDDHECTLLLDCWSVHRSRLFRRLVRIRWPWLRLRYIPGGCTGLAQPCDVGMQRPYKLSIKKSQLQDTINETLAHLEVSEDPSTLKLDSRIGTLRDRSVAWGVKAWNDVNNPELIQKVRS